jgi:hypothetical protein
MIAKHRDILNASDRKQPWAENCMTADLRTHRDDELPISSTLCYDVAFVEDLSPKGFSGVKAAKIANQAILKMMGKL